MYVFCHRMPISFKIMYTAYFIYTYARGSFVSHISYLLTWWGSVFTAIYYMYVLLICIYIYISHISIFRRYNHILFHRMSHSSMPNLLQIDQINIPKYSYWIIYEAIYQGNVSTIRPCSHQQIALLVWYWRRTNGDMTFQNKLLM